MAYHFSAAGTFSIDSGGLYALFVEAFGARMRYSGISHGFQLANVFGSGFGPAAVTILHPR